VQCSPSKPFRAEQPAQLMQAAYVACHSSVQNAVFTASASGTYFPHVLHESQRVTFRSRNREIGDLRGVRVRIFLPIVASFSSAISLSCARSMV